MNEQIEIIKRLDKELVVLDNKVDELAKVDDVYQEIEKKCDAKTKARLNWASAFGVYTLYHLWLKMNKINPRDHPIKKEIKRLQEFRDKIIESIRNNVNQHNDMTNTTTGNIINKIVAKKTVTNFLGNKRENDTKAIENKPIKKYK